ncbi:Nitrogen regulation protein NR(I) [gamma proteobacterium IMCC2047]|nr:Nitrogen regulation protein NR(I) [gamma proteobacterium IMCC2047]
MHQHSPRASKPFIALNMAAIPKDLIESELFGHEKGAFTGAMAQRKGRFEQADGGTLFLDEIGDMPAETQTRLLRVLADGEFYRVGGHTPVKVNVRIIAATHQDLEQRVREHRFREDLFHRLNVIRIQLPSLKERREDIPALAQYFLTKSARDLQMESKVLTQQSQDYLCSLDWPGNVRQLENVCHWLTVMASSREIQLSDLPPELLARAPSTHNEADWQQALANWAKQQLESPTPDTLQQALPDFERVMIKTVLAHTRGRRGEAAKLLGWGRNTLTRKLKDLDNS